MSIDSFTASMISNVPEDEIPNLPEGLFSELNEQRLKG